MRAFQHVTPPLRLWCGPDAFKGLGRELDRLNSHRAVVVCGNSLSRDAGLMAMLREAAGERLAGIVAGARAHSPADAVQAAAAELRRLEADAVIAVGGGSAIVTARAATILLAEQGGLKDLATAQTPSGELRSPKLLAPKLPQVVVPTTPTTAIAKAGSAVLDPESGERRALFDPKTRTQSVFVHPAFLLSAPHALVASAGLNTLSMAVEGLMARGGNPIADALLMQALRLCMRHLPRPELDEDARAELVMAALLCGQGTDHTGGGMNTVFGHAIGTRHSLENGVVNAITLPAVLRFNAEASPGGLEKVAAALGAPDAPDPLGAVLGRLDTVFRTLSVPVRLTDVGVTAADLPEIAELAMCDWFLRGNPRPVQAASELVQVLQNACE